MTVYQRGLVIDSQRKSEVDAIAGQYIKGDW